MRSATGALVAVTAIVLTGLAPSAGANIGVMRKLEICDDAGHWQSAGGVAVLTSGEVLATDDVGDEDGNFGRIRRFSSTGQPLGFVRISGLPEGVKVREDMLIDRGPSGIFYLTAPSDRRIFEVRLSGSTGQVVREILPITGQVWPRPDGLVASRSNGGLLFILDSETSVTISRIDDGSPQLQTNASGDAIASASGAMILGSTNADGTRGSLDYYFVKAGGGLDEPVHRQLDFGVSDLGGAVDNSLWIVSGAAVVHTTPSGGVIDRVDVGGNPFHHIDARDGTAWVTRAGELLHLGDGGSKLGPSGYHSSGAANCGPPRLRASYAKVQQIFEKRRLDLDARCGETCTVTVAGRLRAPARSRKSFVLTPGRVRLTGTGSGKLPLRFGAKALSALRAALSKSGGTARIDATIVATDTDRNRVTSKRSLVLSR